MKQNLFLLYFTANFSGADRFIGVASPLLSWSGAQDYCRKYHTDLASSLNSSDQAMLMRVSNIQGDSWFGLSRDSWKWLEGANASKVKWYPGQPSNNWGNEYCAGIFNGLFFDEPCATLRYFICDTISPVRSQTVKLQVKSDVRVFDPAVQSFILDQIKQTLKEHLVMENATVTWRVQPDGNIFHKKKQETIASKC
ncbi:C-type lectin lectoxin-Lio3-like isoform X2 [Hemibagrus wyckioides]|uniref:C-type lectin lectoxin-Lio3-like isoform X2 n=1 Tax=Hemibagrus wyckioides TaxID=337641 RepID=UPI00266D6791|nr:C-type lectin lectoxin-Lio3-like isoform X2 [Hemibagrus wyckioides]